MFSYLPFFWDFIFSPEKLQVGDISGYEKRFEAVNRILPEHGVIGYLSDCSDMSDMHCIARFYVAQYALSPIILDRSPEHTLVIADFGKAGANLWDSGSNAMNLLMDSGNGIKLYLVDGK